MADGQYARVYWSIADDPEFESVFDDDAALALWVRLLLIGDQAWPAAGHLPRSAKARSLATLTDAGLVEVLRGDRFRIRGMNAERAKRQQHASNAASTRWGNAPSIPPSIARTMPSRAEHSKAEPSRAEYREEIATALEKRLGKPT